MSAYEKMPSEQDAIYMRRVAFVAVVVSTVAVIASVSFAVSEPTSPVSVTVIGATAFLTVMLAEADLVVSFTEVAVIVTAPEGATEGAV